MMMIMMMMMMNESGFGATCISDAMFRFITLNIDNELEKANLLSMMHGKKVIRKFFHRQT